MTKTHDTPKETRRRITKEVPLLPLFMSAGRSRLSEAVMMSATTSREMHRYIRWAAALAKVPKEEAQAMMLDRAIGDYLRRDEAWQAEKKGDAEPDRTDGAGDGSPAARPRVAAPGSASLPGVARGAGHPGAFGEGK